MGELILMIGELIYEIRVPIFGGFNLGVDLNEIDDDYVYIMWPINQLSD